MNSISESTPSIPPKPSIPEPFEYEEDEISINENANLLNSPTLSIAALLDKPPESKRRIAMLGCALCLSIGSHYASSTLGPLKHSLAADEKTFSSYISAFELLNTVTPLISGIAVTKFGAARTAILATSLVVFGLIIVNLSSNPGVMIIGLLIFGGGLAPLAVCQEAIIIGFRSKYLAKSIACGLLVGKFFSFLSAISSVPLSKIRPRLPFEVSLILALISFTFALVYWRLERHGELGNEKNERDFRSLTVQEVTNLGDSFYFYLFVCLLVGGWYASHHLSTSILSTLYDTPSTYAASVASLIQLGSVLLYPIIGIIVDYRPDILSKLFYIATSFNVVTNVLLLSFAPRLPMIVAFLPTAIACGGGPLLIVLAITRILPFEKVSSNSANKIPIALALHKMAEMAGGVIIQSCLSRVIATDGTEVSRVREVLKYLSLFGLIQFLITTLLWRTIYKKEKAGEEYLVTEREKFRGKVGLFIAGLFLIASWIVFFLNLPK